MDMPRSLAYLALIMLPAFRIFLALCIMAIGASCQRTTEKSPTPAVPRIAAITLKYQDSAGTREKHLPGDSLPKSLREIVSAIRSVPLGRRISQSDADTGEEFSLGGLCGCEAPDDSLEIRFADGSLEQYRFYCSGIEKAVGTHLIEVDLPDAGKSATNGRWDAVRARFCPKGFGCDDGVPGSNANLEVWTDSGWENPVFSHFSDVEYYWQNAVDSVGGQDDSVPMVFTLRSDGKRILSVTIDSVADRYRAAAHAFATFCVRGSREQPASGRYRITAVNYYNEK